jgi:hypothetical protein
MIGGIRTKMSGSVGVSFRKFTPNHISKLSNEIEFIPHYEEKKRRDGDVVRDEAF